MQKDENWQQIVQAIGAEQARHSLCKAVQPMESPALRF